MPHPCNADGCGCAVCGVRESAWDWQQRWQRSSYGAENWESARRYVCCSDVGQSWRRYCRYSPYKRGNRVDRVACASRRHRRFFSGHRHHWAYVLAGTRPVAKRLATLLAGIFPTMVYYCGNGLYISQRPSRLGKIGRGGLDRIYIARNIAQPRLGAVI